MWQGRERRVVDDREEERNKERGMMRGMRGGLSHGTLTCMADARAEDTAAMGVKTGVGLLRLRRVVGSM